MRAKEFITESPKSKISKNLEYSGLHSMTLGNKDYYSHYRLGLAMAGSPDLDSPKSSPAGDEGHIWMYSEADEEIAKTAMKQQGIKGKTFVPKGPSVEVPAINKQSPVVQRKKNKYGV